ncbi:MAG: phosphate ABC transporter permease family protein, partial [Alphaproteobacteria bacterium]|nr:phosphate ABC transporter permease family protein [Alphaproteobacteria bacterium]
MTWLFLPLLIVVAVVAFLGGRAIARRRQQGVRAHSRPGQHGAYALIWAVVPALAVIVAAGVLAPALGAVATAAGAALAAVLGGLFAFSRIQPELRARNRVEAWIVGLLFAASVVAVLVTVGIIAALVFDSLRFFASVPIGEFLFGTQWSPQTAIRADQVGSTGAFGALPLFAGTFLIMLIAMTVAAPIGLFAAIYLSEYAGPVFRAVVKPVLEVLAGVPTVVYGFFAALTVGPAFREFFNGIGALLVGGPLDGLG